MSDLLAIGASGIKAYSRALSVVGDNIANAQTDGYVRRTVRLEEAPAAGDILLSGSGVFPGGVTAAGVTRGRFREDLFFRLGVVLLHMPTLAERTEDIAQLIAHFQRGKGTVQCRFDSSAIERLQSHSWPGNVRELRNIVERANVLFHGDTIDAFGVDQLLGRAAPRLQAPQRLERFPDPASTPIQTCDAPIDLKAQIEGIELERIQTALSRADGVISEAARLLTLKRTTLIEKMRKYGVDRIAVQ
jgi:sigma-54 specific flagellar transcriptional regulator A